MPEQYIRDLQRQIAQLKDLQSDTPAPATTLPPGWRGSESEAETGPSVLTPTYLHPRPRTARAATENQRESPTLCTPDSLPRRIIDGTELFYVVAPCHDLLLTLSLATNSTINEFPSSVAESIVNPSPRVEHGTYITPQAYNPLVARDVAYVSGSDDRRLCTLSPGWIDPIF